MQHGKPRTIARKFSIRGFTFVQGNGHWWIWWKTPPNYNASYFNLGGGALFGGDNSPKSLPRRRDGQTSVLRCNWNKALKVCNRGDTALPWKSITQCVETARSHIHQICLKVRFFSLFHACWKTCNLHWSHPLIQWCRAESASPKVLICRKYGQNTWKSGHIPWKSGQKMALTLLDFKKWYPTFAEKRMKTFLGRPHQKERKLFRQNSHTTFLETLGKNPCHLPKFCLLQHPWIDSFTIFLYLCFLHFHEHNRTRQFLWHV